MSSTSDLVFSVLFRPLTLLWAVLPTCAKKGLKSISIRVLAEVVGLVWSLCCALYVGKLFLSFNERYVLMAIDVVMENVRPFIVRVSQHRDPLLDWLLIGLFVFVILMLLASILPNAGVIPQNTIKYKEKAMQGSDFLPNMSFPAVQAKLLTRTYNSDGTTEDSFLGSGFRDEFDQFVTAYHNIEDEHTIVIETDNCQVVCPASRFRQVPFQDIAYVRLDAGEFSALGLKKASYERAEPDQGERHFACIYGPENHTMGSIQGIKDFGQVVYSGSTARGYSGAPYLSHHKVLGMHLGHGVMNGGPSGAYMKSLFETVKESSEDVLVKHMRNEVRRGKELQWETVPTDPDCVRVRWGKGYKILDKDTFFEITTLQKFERETLKAPRLEEKLAPQDLSYDDSKNGFRASAAARANAGASGQTSAMLSNVHNVLEQLRMEETPIQDSQCDSDSDAEDMENQQLTLAQQKEVLSYMLNNTIRQLEKRRRRKDRKSGQPSSSPLNSLPHGKSELQERKTPGSKANSNRP